VTNFANSLKKTNPSSNSRTSDLAEAVSRESYLYLTTRGRRSGLPREIEIWFTLQAGRFYVIAEYETSNWLRNIQANPEVQVRIASTGFAAHARILSGDNDATLIAAVANLSRQKYAWGDGVVVELTPQK